MRWIVFALRFLWMNVVAVLALIAYGFGRLRTFFVREPEARADAVAKLRGKILRLSMGALGATFIKMGQVMSTRRDLFPGAMIDELRLLQDRLPPFPYELAEQTLRRELGRDFEGQIEHLEKEPVAAASVAQVHRAKLVSGETVAIKILRPDVRDNVLRDAAILGVGARLLALHPTLRLSDPVGHLDELVQGILDQTDLRIEAENNRRFQENFRDVEDVVFPQLFPRLCTARVLTMEFMCGEKVDALPEGTDHAELADTLSHCFLKMCFEDGFLHADMHPGNFLVMEDGRVAVFDLGLAKQLGDDLFEEFVDFTRCMAMGTSEDMVRHMKTFHHYMEGEVDWETMETDMADLVQRFRGQTKAELEMGEMFDDMFALGRKYKVQPRTELTLIIVGMITAEGVGKQIDAEQDTFAQVAQFLMPIIARRGLPRAR